MFMPFSSSSVVYSLRIAQLSEKINKTYRMSGVGFVWNNKSTFPHFQQNFQHSFVQGADFFVFSVQKKMAAFVENVMRADGRRRAEGEKCTNNRVFRKILILTFFCPQNPPRETRKISFCCPKWGSFFTGGTKNRL
ncbi:MAG TPA: hypothetical protein DCE08_04040 [Ruminococcaceae bacterium]|nr:hypothetical protein [Oscillospiraceae bacterium]